MFRKTGDAPVEFIKCSCGHEIKGSVTECPGCGKVLVPTELQISPPPDKDPPKDPAK